MDDFKRVYSNEDTEKKAIPFFWEKFDKENYSIWHCVYKYPEDLTMVFMSCNLISGFVEIRAPRPDAQACSNVSTRCASTPLAR